VISVLSKHEIVCAFTTCVMIIVTNWWQCTCSRQLDCVM